MDDMHEQQETPTSDAARGVGHYLTATLAATDLSVRMLTWMHSRTHSPAPGPNLGEHELQPGDLERAAAVLDPTGEAHHAMLGPDQGRDADSHTALLAWVGAQPHRDDDPQAALVAARAQARLRDLHPDAMSRYDQLRASLSPVEAMREVAPLIAAERQHAGARELYAPMLEPGAAASADSSQALDAWTAALPHTDNLPDAAAAAAAAADRLRELQPGAMTGYDQLRQTHTSADAVEEIGSLIDPALSAQLAGPAGPGSSASPAEPEAVLAPEVRYAPVVREVLQAELADQVLHDQAWPALAGSLARAEHLGAQPAALLASAAGERELASAKSVAEVLAFRVEQHQVPAQTGPPRTPTAADLAAASYPAPPQPARPSARPQPQDLAVLGAALELGREADSERRAARERADTADDVSTPRVAVRHAGLPDARNHGQAGADRAAATALVSKDVATRATAPGGAHASTTAAQSYPSPVHDVTAGLVARTSNPAPTGTHAGTRNTPKAGRRR